MSMPVQPLMSGASEQGFGYVPMQGTKCPACFMILGQMPNHTQDGVDVCEHCGFQAIPFGWREAVVTCISFTGATAAGKSIYLGVMVKELCRWAEEHGGYPQFYRDSGLDCEKEYKDRYERELFELRKILQGTPPETDDARLQPIILDMGTIFGRQYFFVLRDVAGEDLEAFEIGRDVDNIKKRLSYIERSDLVVFLFDPVTIEDIRSYLSNIKNSLSNPGQDPARVFRNLLVHFPGIKNTKLAVTVSKFDFLQAIGSTSKVPDSDQYKQMMSNLGSPMIRESKGWYDENDSQILNEELNSLLVKLNARGFVNLVKNATGNRFRFFAVSALGLTDHTNKVSSSGIAPFRVLDPVMWVLNYRDSTSGQSVQQTVSQGVPQSQPAQMPPSYGVDMLANAEPKKKSILGLFGR